MLVRSNIQTSIYRQDFKVKQLEAQLNELKSTSATPLLEHVITAHHLPCHIFILASPTTIAKVIHLLSLPYPRVIPCHEWGNSLESVPWTQHRKYPFGSFIKIQEAGTYFGDLGYVIATDFKVDRSVTVLKPQVAIVLTPQSVIVTVVPQIQVKPSQGQKVPLNDNAQSAVVEAQFDAVFQVESWCLGQVVKFTCKHGRIASLHKALMKEKDDLVWGHGQVKREIEKQVADLMGDNTKARQDLERVLTWASSLHKSSIKQELEGLQNEAWSIQQHASERLVAANASQESLLESIWAHIAGIQSPENPAQRRKPLPALFDYENVESISPGSCHHFMYTGDNTFEFTNDFPFCFDRPAIVTDPHTHQPVVESKSVTLWTLDSVISPLNGECIFFFKGCTFLHGLELIPVHDNRALEIAHPNTQKLKPFVKSKFDSPCINCLFSALHWTRGDKLTYADEHGPWYYLWEILWKDQSIRAMKINPNFRDWDLDSSASGLNNVQLHLQWTKRVFTVCDLVEVTFGPHKGNCGTLTVVEG